MVPPRKSVPSLREEGHIQTLRGFTTHPGVRYVICLCGEFLPQWYSPEFSEDVTPPRVVVLQRRHTPLIHLLTVRSEIWSWAMHMYFLAGREGVCHK